MLGWGESEEGDLGGGRLPELAVIEVGVAALPGNSHPGRISSGGGLKDSTLRMCGH